MERLTKRLPDGKTVMDCDSCEQKKDKQCTFYECRASLIKRLAAYEDTGLEPETVETVKLALVAKHMVDLETLNNTPISRLVELAEADKDGRCVVLPCKVGAYMIDQIFPERPRLMKNVRPSIVYVSKGAIYNMALETFESAVAEGLIMPASEEAERAMEGRKDG